MAEMLLINPRGRRRKTRKASKRRARKSTRTVRRTVFFAPPKRKRRARKTSRRRRNPVSMRAVTRRNRNPVRLGGMFSGLVPMVRDAAVGATGAVAVDLAMGQINRYLPAALQVVPGTVSAGDAVKAVITVALGQLLRRPTRGLSQKMAQGALTVQAHRIITSMLPANITSQLAYASPAYVIPGRQTVQPNALNRMAAYTPPGSPSPLLNAYTRPGSASPLLNGIRSDRTVRNRAGIPT